jgi:hypothetical protein
MSTLVVLGTLLVLGCAAFLALYVTFLFVHRLRRGDTGPRSFGTWLRDLFDVASGLG